MYVCMFQHLQSCEIDLVELRACIHIDLCKLYSLLADSTNFVPPKIDFILPKTDHIICIFIVIRCIKQLYKNNCRDVFIIESVVDNESMLYLG